MRVEQFVMARGVEQDRLRALLPINAEIRDGAVGYVELNTAAEKDGNRGWLNIGKTLPAYPEEVQTVYPRQDCTAQNAAASTCRQVLGAYMAAFDRS